MTQITDSNFEEFINSDAVTVVDFWAEWCGPCLAIAPILEEVSKELPLVKFGKLNVDLNPVTATSFNIMNIPTLLIFKNKKLVDKQVGAVSKTILRKKIETYM